MEKQTEVMPFGETDIQARILTIRGVQVMLDRDLAVLYQVMTGRLNEAVKRNIERFPEEFRFQLTKSEVEELIANCDNLESLKFAPVRPYAFTEQGVAMLSAVLKSGVAVRESIRIMKAFVEMRRTLVSLAPSLVTLSARIEANERRQIADQSRNEARFDEIFARMSGGELPEHQIFYQGKF